MIFGRTVFEKDAMITCKNSKLGQFYNFEFLQVKIAFYCNTLQPRNMKFGLNINFSIYFICTKLDFFLLHTIREKCDANLQNLHFSQIMSDRETSNFSVYSTYKSEYLDQISCSSIAHYLKKNVMLTCKNSKLQKCPNF